MPPTSAFSTSSDSNRYDLVNAPEASLKKVGWTFLAGVRLESQTAFGAEKERHEQLHVRLVCLSKAVSS